MSAAAKTNEAFAHETPVELAELQKAIDSLPVAQRVTLIPAFQRVVDSTNRRRKILNLVQEALGQLRLDMKYLVFDLEATRRERDTYREQLQSFNFEDEGTENKEDEDMF
jgi:hypothetical protein